MRLRLRLRTALIAVALLGPPLAVIAVVARHGGLSAFRAHHAALAYRYWVEADNLHIRAEICREHGEPAGRIEELRRREREYLRRSWWHRLLSGRPIPTART